VEAELVADPQQVASSLAARLAAVPDPRALRGRRHRLVVILVLAACATLVVGNDSMAAIWQWAAGAASLRLAQSAGTVASPGPIWSGLAAWSAIRKHGHRPRGR
jgi:hypothetical protein